MPDVAGLPPALTPAPGERGVLTADGAGAYSGLRSNPLTGEMIDGDVVFDDGLMLDCGVQLPRLEVAYRTYLLGHTAWFGTDAGAALCDHLQRWARRAD